MQLTVQKIDPDLFNQLGMALGFDETTVYVMVPYDPPGPVTLEDLQEDMDRGFDGQPFVVVPR